MNNLKALAEAFLSQSSVGRSVNQRAITGMGGLGKTQLAVEFAYRYGSYFRGVHWLNIADPTLLDSEIVQCGLQMSLDNWPDDQPSQVVLTLNTWKADGPRLLVLDNFEDVEKLNRVLPRLHHSSLSLLITSRRTDWPATAGLRSLALELFTRDESLAFLKKALHMRKDNDEALTILAERLGHLPLALELASRFLSSHPRLSIDLYLDQTKQAFDHPSMRDWRKDLPAPTQHDLDLQRTFARSWDAVQDETPRKIFQMAGYLAPNVPIPPRTFERALEISTETCDESLSRLYGMGLLHMTESNEPAIHPLLGEYGRGLTREKTETLKEVAEALEALSRVANDTGLPSRFIPWRSHMPILASHAEDFAVKSAGMLWNNYGFHLKMIADYSGARHAYERALKIDEAAFGLDHPIVAIRVNNLGGVLQDWGDFEGALAAIERALQIDEASFGPDHPNVATDLNNLGSVLHDLGDLEVARRALERALRIDEASFGSYHANIARDLNNLGTVLHDLGNLEDAQTVLERALQIDEVTFGADHPNVARDLNNLGAVRQTLGDLKGARTVFERALKIRERVFGKEHPEVAGCLWRIGVLAYHQKEKEIARDSLERALHIYREFLLPTHPNIKIVQKNLDLLL